MNLGGRGVARLVAWLLALSLSGAATPLAAQAGTPQPAQAAPPATTAAPPQRIATSVLATQPLLENPAISPDGRNVAAAVEIGGEDAITILPVTGGAPRAAKLGKALELRWYRWAGNGTLLVSVGRTTPWLGETAYQTRLLAIDIASMAVRFVGGKEEGLVGDDLLWIDPEGRSILLAFQHTIYEYPSVFSIDLASGKPREIVAARQDVWDWYADEGGVVRAGIRTDRDRWALLYRTTEAEKFHAVVKGRTGDEDAGFDAFRIYQGSDQGYRIMANEDTGRFALYRFNFATRERGELVFGSATNDIDDFDTEPGGSKPLAAWYSDDRPRVHWFDPGMAELQALLDKAVGSRSAQIVSRSRDDNVVLVRLGASNDPGGYYVFSRGDGMLHPFARVNEKLRAPQLAPSRYTSYPARDGLTIPAYLTLPLGRAPRGLPLVILPHGGPYDVRDDGDYDAEVQLLANRGYAVLQPQFRGSSSYGHAFYEKGEGQWGRTMQDDLDDGMDWLVKQGLVDAKRVCIVGGSYGGYAALWGATRNPERYRCAASFAGVSDLPAQLKYQLEFRVSKRYRKDWRTIVQGASDVDLRQFSPIAAVDRLKVPVLLMHGDADPRVPYRQSKSYADALKAAGKPHEFYTLAGEGHGFATAANRQLWFDKLDAFLARYNPAE